MSRTLVDEWLFSRLMVFLTLNYDAFSSPNYIRASHCHFLFLTCERFFIVHHIVPSLGFSIATSSSFEIFGGLTSVAGANVALYYGGKDGACMKLT